MKQKSFYKVPDEARCPRIKPCFLCLSLSIQQCPGGSHLLIVKMAPVSLEINMHTVLLFKRITLFSLLLVEMVSTYLDVQRGYQKTALYHSCLQSASHPIELRKPSAAGSLASPGVVASTYALGSPSCMSHGRRHYYAILIIKSYGVKETWVKNYSSTMY